MRQEISFLPGNNSVDNEFCEIFTFSLKQYKMISNSYFKVILIIFLIFISGNPGISRSEILSGTGFQGSDPGKTTCDTLTAIDNQAELQERIRHESSFTLLVNNNEVFPLKDLEKGRMAYLSIGEAKKFGSRLNDYKQMPEIRIDPSDYRSFYEAISEIGEYDRIIAGIPAAALAVNGMNRPVLNELMRVLAERETVLVFFGPPHFLGQWRGIEKVDALLLAYEDNDMVHDLAAQMVFGAVGASGRLQDPAGDLFASGHGLDSEGEIRLKYTVPEEAGLNSRRIEQGIDSIVNTGLSSGAFPGCRVMVAHKGRIIADKAYGYHTYDGRVKVEKDDIYDLASVTKITGPLPLYMKLVDEGLMDVDMPLSHYWDDWKSRLFRRSNKKGLIMRDLLTHQSGLVPYINYWEQTTRNGSYKRGMYRPEPDDRYSLEISNHLFLSNKFRKKVYRTIRKSDLLAHGEYRYSCLSFIVAPEVIKEIDGRQYKTALYEDFLRPLGARSLRYNPLDHFPAHMIVPTESDNNFRKELVHGYVHDEASAVLGGVSGNAGLFSSAGDLAKLLQMYLNGGEYGGRRYLSEEVLAEFTRVQFPENDNRRGLGFDKPLIDNNLLSSESAYPSAGASPSSFGHAGFTGTFVWMDPEYDLLYIFLSNRVYPTRENNLISRLNIRTEILQLFYDEINRQENQ